MRLFCIGCNVPIYENPVPASCSVVVDRGERVLLVRRSAPPRVGYWCLPGGFMELGESPEETALRELREESGIKGRIEQLLGVTAGHDNPAGTVLITGYLIREFSGTPVPGDDASEAAFFHLDRLPEIAFESHAGFLRLYRAGFSPKD